MAQCYPACFWPTPHHLPSGDVQASTLKGSKEGREEEGKKGREGGGWRRNRRRKGNHKVSLLRSDYSHLHSTVGLELQLCFFLGKGPDVIMRGRQCHFWRAVGLSTIGQSASSACWYVTLFLMTAPHSHPRTVGPQQSW